MKRKRKWYVISFILMVLLIVATTSYFYLNQDKQVIYRGTFVNHFEDEYLL